MQRSIIQVQPYVQNMVHVDFKHTFLSPSPFKISRLETVNSKDVKEEKIEKRVRSILKVLIRRARYSASDRCWYDARRCKSLLYRWFTCNSVEFASVEFYKTGSERRTCSGGRAPPRSLPQPSAITGRRIERNYRDPRGVQDKIRDLRNCRFRPIPSGHPL